jgi:hypothetical protein
MAAAAAAISPAAAEVVAAAPTKKRKRNSTTLTDTRTERRIETKEIPWDQVKAKPLGWKCRESVRATCPFRKPDTKPTVANRQCPFMWFGLSQLGKYQPRLQRPLWYVFMVCMQMLGELVTGECMVGHRIQSVKPDHSSILIEHPETKQQYQVFADSGYPGWSHRMDNRGRGALEFYADDGDTKHIVGQMITRSIFDHDDWSGSYSEIWVGIQLENGSEIWAKHTHKDKEDPEEPYDLPGGFSKTPIS